MNKSKTKNITMILSLVVLLLAAGLIFAHFYIVGLAEEIVEIKKSSVTSNNQYLPEEIVDRKLLESENVIKQLDTYYLNRQDLVGFIENLESVAINNNVEMTIDNISINETHLSDVPVPYGILDATISVKGSWVGVGDYLSDIENLPLAVKITNTRLSRGGSDSWNLNLAIEIITN